MTEQTIKSKLSNRLSVFSNVRSSRFPIVEKSKDHETTVHDILDRIKSPSERDKKAILAVRNLKAIDKNKYSQEKSNLPCVTFASYYGSNQRLKGGEFDYTGFVYCDIDGVSSDNGELASIRQKLVNDKHVVALWTSLSGTGLGFLVSPTELNKNTFTVIYNYYNNLGIHLDVAARDIVSRLNIISYDGNMHLNVNACEIKVPSERVKVVDKYTVQTTSESVGVCDNQSINKTIVEKEVPDCYMGRELMISYRYTEKFFRYVEGQRNNYLGKFCGKASGFGVPVNVAINFLRSKFADIDEFKVRMYYDGCAESFGCNPLYVVPRKETQHFDCILNDDQFLSDRYNNIEDFYNKIIVSSTGTGKTQFVINCNSNFKKVILTANVATCEATYESFNKSNAAADKLYGTIDNIASAQEILDNIYKVKQQLKVTVDKQDIEELHNQLKLYNDNLKASMYVATIASYKRFSMQNMRSDYVLILDEIDQLVRNSGSDFMMNDIYTVVSKIKRDIELGLCKGVVGFTATPNNQIVDIFSPFLNMEFFYVLKKNNIKQTVEYINTGKGGIFNAVIDKVVEIKKRKEKTILALNNKGELLDKYEAQFKNIGINYAVFNADTVNNEYNQKLISEQALPDELDVLIVTSSFEAGVNLKNTHPDGKEFVSNLITIGYHTFDSRVQVVGRQRNATIRNIYIISKSELNGKPVLPKVTAKMTQASKMVSDAYNHSIKVWEQLGYTDDVITLLLRDGCKKHNALSIARIIYTRDADYYRVCVPNHVSIAHEQYKSDNKALQSCRELLQAEWERRGWTFVYTKVKNVERADAGEVNEIVKGVIKAKQHKACDIIDEICEDGLYENHTRFNSEGNLINDDGMDAIEKNVRIDANFIYKTIEPEKNVETFLKYVTLDSRSKNTFKRAISIRQDLLHGITTDLTILHKKIVSSFNVGEYYTPDNIHNTISNIVSSSVLTKPITLTKTKTTQMLSEIYEITKTKKNKKHIYKIDRIHDIPVKLRTLDERAMNAMNEIKVVDIHKNDVKMVDTSNDALYMPVDDDIDCTGMPDFASEYLDSAVADMNRYDYGYDTDSVDVAAYAY